jgi:hypothetical protein
VVIIPHTCHNIHNLVYIANNGGLGGLMTGHISTANITTCTHLRHGIALLNAIQFEAYYCMCSSSKEQWLLEDDLSNLLYHKAWSIT